MWRKKVDSSLFRHKGTTVPRWIASMWNLDKYFPDIGGVSNKNSANTKTNIVFNKKTYNGNLTCTFPKNRAKHSIRDNFNQTEVEELLFE